MSNKRDNDFEASEQEEFTDEEIEYEELDFEEQPQVRRREDEEEWEEDWEDEPQPMKPLTMVLVFAGLVILAAIICAVLWHFTHGNKETDSQPSQPAVTAEATPEPSPEATEEPAPEPTMAPAATPESTEEPAPEVTATLEITAVPETTQTPDAESTAVQEPISGNETMTFTEVQETVTAKDVINLRSLPSTADAGNIVTQAQNGETLTRTGINNDTGWSRLDYNGQTLYAVSQYLTTDLSYQAPVQSQNPNRVSTKDGRVIIFTDCDDTISPKEYVNLRLEPSTSEGNSTVHCQLNYGEVAHRTGYSADSGWSRVEYDGKVLYVVTSMVYVVTE